MKKLVFIDNDRSDEKNDSTKQAQRFARNNGMPYEAVDSMEAIYDFTTVDRDKQFDIMYSPENVIITWSMYTASHYGSLQQLKRFLVTAGSSDVTGKVYIDGSGEIVEALERLFREDEKGIYAMMNAIETNHIITRRGMEAHYMTLALCGKWKCPFEFEKVDLKDFI